LARKPNAHRKALGGKGKPKITWHELKSVLVKGTPTVNRKKDKVDS